MMQYRGLRLLLRRVTKHCGWPTGRIAGLSVLLSLGLMHSAQGETLTAASDHWPPFFMEANGQLSGIGHDILSEIARRTGDNINMRKLPNKRALKMFDDNKLDLIVIDSASGTTRRTFPACCFRMS